MIMKVLVEHRTTYTYGQAVSFSPHVIRLFPRSAPHIRIASQTLNVSADANTMPGLDIYDNIINTVFLPRETKSFSAETRLVLEIDEFNPFNFLVASHALFCPFTYQSAESAILSPFLEPQEAPITLPFFEMPKQPEPTVETLIAITQAVHKNIEYERRDEGEARSAHETLKEKRGACRDTAVLMAEYLRQQKIATRIVSGYLCEFDVRESKRRAEGSLHAWTEAFIPGAGWLGLDGTNGILCNENFVPLAAGLRPQDISPLSGLYYHDSDVESEMKTELNLSLM